MIKLILSLGIQATTKKKQNNTKQVLCLVFCSVIDSNNNIHNVLPLYLVAAIDIHFNVTNVATCEPPSLPNIIWINSADIDG